MIETGNTLHPSPEEVRKMSRQVKRSEIAGRTFNGYCLMLGLYPDRLANQKILDVGAGDSTFAYVAESKYGAKVTRLDARYSSDSIGYPDKSEKVAGYMQYLPFKDNSFDQTIALYSLNWLETTRDVNRALLEMIRVTRKSVKICPVYFKFGQKDSVKFDEELKGEPIGLTLRHVAQYPSFYGLEIYKDGHSHNWDGVINKLGSCLEFNLEARTQRALEVLGLSCSGSH